MSLAPPTERCPHGKTIYRLPDGLAVSLCIECNPERDLGPPDETCIHGRPLFKLFGGSEQRSPVCDPCMEEARAEARQAESEGRRLRRETFYPSATEQKEIDVELPTPKSKETSVTDDELPAIYPPSRPPTPSPYPGGPFDDVAQHPDVLASVLEHSGPVPVLRLPRVSWDEYFMAIAVQVATRATCDRKHVGAVIVRNRTILSTGYNGSPRGLPHCDDAGHEMKDMGGRESCIRTVHAEANAIAQAARTGMAIEGAELYTTASPCYDCLKLIINAGIVRVVCLEFYASRYGVSGNMEALAQDAGVKMVFLKKEGQTL